MPHLALVRHGQSDYNLKNLFTGWVDSELTEKGMSEAHATAAALKARGFMPEICFTSNLKRAQKTLAIILEDLGLTSLPIVKDQALNERHYGDLQGKNKKETAEQYGEAQVHIWRRSFDVAPPGGESLKDTAERAVPYFTGEIVPVLRQNKDVLVVAHGNSLRALIMEIEKLSPEEILKRELATGEATIYRVDFESSHQTYQLERGL
jgi:2,3-bisphosphoglycerate-dependent phosphoglycerate mutase